MEFGIAVAVLLIAFCAVARHLTRSERDVVRGATKLALGALIIATGLRAAFDLLQFLARAIG